MHHDNHVVLRHQRAVALVLRVIACVGLTASLSACGGTSTVSPIPTAQISSLHRSQSRLFGKIGHVVIIVQENRTVDNLFNGFPGADTSQTGKTHEGRIVRLKPISLKNHYDICHSHQCWLTAWYHGGMDGFDRVSKGSPDKLFNYAIVPRSETIPIWSLATQYTFADRMFQTNTGPSFPAHLYLIAGQSALADNNPEGFSKPVIWGCTAPQGTLVDLLTDPPSEVYPCFEFQTLADDMDAHSVTWHYYAPNMGKQGANWSAYQAIGRIRFGPDWVNDVSSEKEVLRDIKHGRLAQVNWVIPSYHNSDHAGSDSKNGPKWVASVVNALGTSSYWNDTAIFVVWDDWGGWYDHVPPLQLDLMGLGFRVPLIVVSPYAKRTYVSHVSHEFGSILKFVEESFNLPSLGTTDVRADDLADCFNFTQAPTRFRLVAGVPPDSYFLSEPPDPIPPDDD
jgi:phospholipase C